MQITVWLWIISGCLICSLFGMRCFCRCAFVRLILSPSAFCCWTVCWAWSFHRHIHIVYNIHLCILRKFDEFNAYYVVAYVVWRKEAKSNLNCFHIVIPGIILIILFPFFDWDQEWEAMVDMMASRHEKNLPWEEWDIWWKANNEFRIVFYTETYVTDV